MSRTRGSVHLLSGAWPPVASGVADHSWIIARGLASAGYDVHVWTSGGAAAQEAEGVTLHAILTRWSPAELRQLDREIDALPGPRRIVVQWVPHDFGFKSLNVAVPIWAALRAWRGDRVLPVVHEAGFHHRSRRVRILFGALVHRIMATILLRSAADRVLITIPTWRERLERWALGRKIEWQWVPVTSNIEPLHDPAASAAVRTRHDLDGAVVIGSFGIHGEPSLTPLAAMLARVLQREGRVALVIGPWGERVREAVAASSPGAGARVRVSGALRPADVSAHLAACDVLVQPYLDGVSARRTTAMAALAHRRALVTTVGPATERVWSASGAVRMTSMDGDRLAEAVEELLADPGARAELARRGYACYEQNFAPARLIEAFAEALGPP